MADEKVGNTGCFCLLEDSFSYPQNLKPDSTVLCLSVFQDKVIVVGTDNGCYLSYIDLSSKKVTQELISLENREVVSTCSSALDNNLLCVASFNEIFLFDSRISFEKPITSFSENTDEINRIKCNNEGNQLIACDDAGECKIYDLKSNQLYRTLRRTHTNICSTVCYLPNRSDEIVTGGLDCQIIHWDTKRVKPLQFINTQNLLKKHGDDSVYMFNPPIVHSIHVNGNGNYLASGLGNGTIQIFNIHKGKNALTPTLLINKHSSLGVSAVRFVDFSVHQSEEDLVVSGGNDGVINAWRFPLQQQPKQSKQVMTNKVCTDEEMSQYLLGNYKLNSQVNDIESLAINGKQFILVADQTSQVKLLELKQ